MPYQYKRIEKECLICSKSFQVIPSQHWIKFCSKECRFENQRGKPSWNAGLIGWRKGEKHPWMPSGKKHWSWKGDAVGYRQLHTWIQKIRGKAFFCEECGLKEIPVGKKRYFQWANISHHYLRIVEDWKQLCYMCHKQFDGAHREAKETPLR